MKKSTIILIWVFACYGIQAQQSGSAEDYRVVKKLGFNAGYQKRLLLDEQKSALTYMSDEYLAGLSFIRESYGSLLHISIDAGMGNFDAKHFKNRWLYSTTYDIHGTPETDSVLVASGIVSGNLRLSYFSKLNASGKTTWLVGASVKEMLVYPANYIGILNSLGFYANVGLAKETGTRGKLQTYIYLPLIAVNTRLPWHNTATAPLDSEIKTFFKTGTKWVGPGKFRNLQLNVQYDYRIANHWSLGASYTFAWINVPYHQPLKSYLNSLQLQTSFIF